MSPNPQTPYVARREIVSWAMYDFAHSAFGTLVVTFIFSAYYAQAIASDPIQGAIWWTRAVNASAIITALLMPVVGAIGDFGGLKKRFLLIATLVCVALTAGLFRMGPGDVWIAALVFVGASVAYESMQSLANAFLPELSTRENMGRISGLGWGLGYFGGLLCLIPALGMVSGWLPEEGGLNVRATSLLAAGWLLVFSIPTFVFLRERQPRRRAAVGTYVRMGFGRIGDTARELGRYRQAVRLLVARLVYNDGLATAFAMAAIFAAAEFGMETADLLVLGIVVNATAGASAIGFGFIQDRIGGKRTIAITLVLLMVATALAFFARTPGVFWAAAILLGLMVGPNQAASRALLGSFVPKSKQGELFGFYAFSGRLSSVLGPLSYGLILGATGSHRWAIASIIVFLVVGLVLLARVDEKEGVELAVAGVSATK
ncbi:MFS transporter [Candidatus Palauibacter sp.]|uniref:MFS transporter n=1 Tax=Candidatus Palauibacter sp. TaxID=3101350 RepID=UPI003AF27782